MPHVVLRLDLDVAARDFRVAHGVAGGARLLPILDHMQELDLVVLALRVAGHGLHLGRQLRAEHLRSLARRHAEAAMVAVDVALGVGRQIVLAERHRLIGEGHLHVVLAMHAVALFKEEDRGAEGADTTEGEAVRVLPAHLWRVAHAEEIVALLLEPALFLVVGFDRAERRRHAEVHPLLVVRRDEREEAGGQAVDGDQRCNVEALRETVDGRRPSCPAFDGRARVEVRAPAELAVLHG